MRHDANYESVLIRYPNDDPELPGAVLSIHPNNGRTSIQNAGAFHGRAAIIAWETSGDPYRADDVADDQKVFVNAKPKRERPDGSEAVTDEVSAAVAATLLPIDNAAHMPDATAKDAPVTPQVTAQAVADATSPQAAKAVIPTADVKGS
jgi:hypothetical protein